MAFGKIAFDQIVSFKIAADDARGGWFSFSDTGIPVYLVEPVTVLLAQPWMIDTLITDFKEVERMLEQRKEGAIHPMADLRLIEIKTLDQLRELVAEWRQRNLRCFSVDCEWAGNNHVDGTLRSMQFAWSDSEGCYLNFFDELGNLHLGREVNNSGMEVAVPYGRCDHRVAPDEGYTDYVEVGRILGEYLDEVLNQPRNGHRWEPEKLITYIGHQCSADSPWMEQWLHLEVIGRFAFDSLYGQQTVSEYS